MNAWDFLLALATDILALLNFVLVCFVVLRMNWMRPHTPKIEMLAWWCIGTGAFFALMLHLTPGVDPDWGAVLKNIGLLLLVVLVSQPEWRVCLAERRRLLHGPPGGTERRQSDREQRA